MAVHELLEDGARRRRRSARRAKELARRDVEERLRVRRRDRDRVRRSLQKSRGDGGLGLVVAHELRRQLGAGREVERVKTKGAQVLERRARVQQR